MSATVTIGTCALCGRQDADLVGARCWDQFACMDALTAPLRSDQDDD